MGAASAVGRAGAIIAPVAIGYLYGSVGFTNVFLTLVGALALGVVTIVAFGEKTAGRSLEQREGTTARPPPQPAACSSPAPDSSTPSRANSQTPPGWRSPTGGSQPPARGARRPPPTAYA
ncbi:hypothetical protein [Streptomyces californicus]|uniref:hypothetical protein n=1 Tax=Streptomyces californicus TaxID=67351 RepID=UPI0036F4CFC4